MNTLFQNFSPQQGILRKLWRGVTEKIKKRYSVFLNLGVHDGLPPYEAKLVRFTNFLESFSLTFYFLYMGVSFLLHSVFCINICIFLIFAGVLGIYCNYIRSYWMARSIFATSFSLALFLACNSLNIGGSFFALFFPIFISYALYYDLNNGIKTGLVSLLITLACAVGSYALPHHLFFKVELQAEYGNILSLVNYTLSILITLNFIIFIIGHISKTGKLLMEDIQRESQQKQELEEARIKTEEAAKAKSRFLSNISHEIRTPLNGIIGTVNLMSEELHLPHQTQHLEVLKYSSEHMLNLVNDVLDFSMIDTGKLELAEEEFNVKEMIDRVCTVFKHQFHNKNIQFECTIDEKVNKRFKGDEMRLKQVLSNLIGNALKFTIEGKVSVKASVQAMTTGNAIIDFSVEDSGIGMSAEQQRVIFDAFSQVETSTTRKFGGAGLGLSISNRLVNMMGGEIKVVSTPRRGSRFFFSVNLPFTETLKELDKVGKTRQLQPLSGIKLLIAEDSHVNMTITRNFLKRWEIIPDEAVNGKEALELFHQNTYHFLLIDLDMPEIDGYEVLRELRKKDPKVPAVAFSAGVQSNMKENLIKFGFTDFLQKPFKPEDLHAMIIFYAKP